LGAPRGRRSKVHCCAGASSPPGGRTGLVQDSVRHPGTAPGVPREHSRLCREAVRALNGRHAHSASALAPANVHGGRRASRTRPAGANAARHAACAASAAAAGAAPRRARSQRRSAASSSGSPPAASWPAASGGSRARTARSSADCESARDAPTWRSGGRCAGAGPAADAGRPPRCRGRRRTSATTSRPATRACTLACTCASASQCSASSSGLAAEAALLPQKQRRAHCNTYCLAWNSALVAPSPASKHKCVHTRRPHLLCVLSLPAQTSLLAHANGLAGPAAACAVGALV